MNGYRNGLICIFTMIILYQNLWMHENFLPPVSPYDLLLNPKKVRCRLHYGDKISYTMGLAQLTSEYNTKLKTLQEEKNLKDNLNYIAYKKKKISLQKEDDEKSKPITDKYNIDVSMTVDKANIIVA